MHKHLLYLILFCPLYALGEGKLAINISDSLLRSVAQKYGEPASERVAGWGKLMEADRQLLPQDNNLKLARANDYFNQVAWVSDAEHWGIEDYWATPVETLASNGGDCEDFSIGKYFSLLSADLENEKLRITYVKSVTYNQAHMVLAYYSEPSAEPLILDNINGSILPASQRRDLIPVYSFSGESIWLAKERGKKLKTNSQTSLPKWKNLNERFVQELSEGSDASVGPTANPTN